MKSAFTKFALAVAVAAAASGCSNHNERALEWFPQMSDSPAIKAQRIGPFNTAMRVPPDGTVAQNEWVYHYANDPDGAGRDLRNPVPRTKEALQHGQHLFNTYCIVCHGPEGEGNGFIIPKFPQPPTLQSDKVRGWPDGRIFHVITTGQNLMPSYASQLDPDERWAIINYVRVLQRAQNPTEADVKALEREKAGQ
jgi:mono/diheme cytochrome c family protein